MGRGGEGAVFRVRDTKGPLGLRAAKVGASSVTGAELRSLVGLHHENLATYRDAGFLGAAEGRDLDLPAPPPGEDYLWFVTDEADGSLRDDLAMDADGSRAGRLLSPVAGTHLLASIAAGLAHVHQQGKVHSDVKPANVLRFGPFDRPSWRLTDFGIARNLDGRTSVGVAGVSIAWAAPEVLADLKVSPSADVYSAAQTVHMAMAGRRARDGVVDASMPRWIADLLQEMLALDPKARPSAAEVVRRIGAVREPRAGGTTVPGVTVPAPPPDPPDGAGSAGTGGSGRDPERSMRRWAKVGVAATVLAALVAVVGLALSLASESEGEPTASSTSADGAGEGSIDDRTPAEPPASSASPDPSDGPPATGRSGESPGVVAVGTGPSADASILLLDVERGEVMPAGARVTGRDPSASRDGRVLAASVEDEGRDVIVVSRDGGPPIALELDGDSTDPAVSPDGTRIAYVTDVGGDDDIAVIELASGAVSILGSTSSDEDEPSWAVDGSAVAFVRSGSSADTVVVIEVDTEVEVAALGAPGRVRSPSLLPGRRSVAYVAEVAGNPEVLVSALDGSGEPANLTESVNVETGVAALPDGRFLVAADGEDLVLVGPDDASDPVPGTRDARL